MLFDLSKDLITEGLLLFFYKISQLTICLLYIGIQALSISSLVCDDLLSGSDRLLRLLKT